MNETNDKNNSGNRPPRPRLMHAILFWFLLIFLMNTVMNFFAVDHTKEIEYSQFIGLVDADLVTNVRMDNYQHTITLKEGADVIEVATILGILSPGQSIEDIDDEDTQRRMDNLIGLVDNEGTYFTGRIDDPNLYDRLLQHDVTFTQPIIRSNPILGFVASWIFPLVMIYLLYTFLFKRLMKNMGGEGGMGGMMNVGKSRAKMYTMEKKTGITFADVAGQDEAKESLNEMVDFLHHPERYHEIGAKQPKGALLVGPPGTGKTLLAKAVAGEAGVAFFSLSGSEFVEMFVGVGASRVRDLFKQAQTHSPCIIFIDEIDAIGKSRDNVMGGGNDEREQTLNQLLAEMDGFDSSKSVIILAATNRPEVLDKALLRPGRFDRRIIVEKPDLPGREAILAVHAAKVKLDESVSLKDIALMTSGAAGADLANMINEAALHAVRHGRKAISQADLMEAVETVIAGKEKKDRILSPKEKELVAYHEVGHALVAAKLMQADPVQKITIVPRTMGSLGYTLQAPEEERYMTTQRELLARIAVLLAGRAAEEVVFNERSTGAANDIERATQIARGMVAQFGMSDHFGMMGLETTQNQYLDGRNVNNYAEKTGAEIDAETHKIIDSCYNTAVDCIKENREALKRVSEFLIEKETITGKQFMEIMESITI